MQGRELRGRTLYLSSCRGSLRALCYVPPDRWHSLSSCAARAFATPYVPCRPSPACSITITPGLGTPYFGDGFALVFQGDPRGTAAIGGDFGYLGVAEFSPWIRIANSFAIGFCERGRDIIE